MICSDEGLMLETSAFNLFTVANLPYQLSVSRPHRRCTRVSLETNSLVCLLITFFVLLLYILDHSKFLQHQNNVPLFLSFFFKS